MTEDCNVEFPQTMEQIRFILRFFFLTWILTLSYLNFNFFNFLTWIFKIYNEKKFKGASRDFTIINIFVYYFFFTYNIIYITHQNSDAYFC